MEPATSGRIIWYVIFSFKIQTTGKALRLCARDAFFASCLVTSFSWISRAKKKKYSGVPSQFGQCFRNSLEERKLREVWLPISSFPEFNTLHSGEIFATDLKVSWNIWKTKYNSCLKWLIDLNQVLNQENHLFQWVTGFFLCSTSCRVLDNVFCQTRPRTSPLAFVFVRERPWERGCVSLKGGKWL